MEIIVPRTTTFPGLIARARTFRLILNPAGLWIIHLGNAMGPPPPNHPIGRLVGIWLKRLAAKLSAKLTKVEHEIASIPLPVLVERSKHSFHIPLGEPCIVRLESNKNGRPCLRIKSLPGKISLNGTETDRKAFAEIAERFKPNLR